MPAVGRPIDRVDGRAKVTGGARYAGDGVPDRVAYAAAVDSTIARGRVLSIDAAQARAATGVLLVLTHENAPRLRALPAGAAGTPGEDRIPLSDPAVHYAGQHIAVVVAETFERAQSGAALLRVRYAEERPVLRFDEAEATATQPARFADTDVQHRRGDVEAALRAPGLVTIRQTYTTPVETHNPLEPSATLAAWDGDRLTVHVATQNVDGAQAVLAEVFGLARRNVRVLCPFTGGGFGGKGALWPHTILAAMAARAAGRPVKLALTRAEMFTSSGHRPPHVQTLTLAADGRGRLAAIRHETTTPTSPVKSWFAPSGVTTSGMLYACPNAETPHTLLRVNVATPTFMRAPAQTPGMFALESAMDELAYALGLDPLELRLRNHADANPIDGKPWSGKHLRECYALGAERFGWVRRPAAPGSMREGGRLVGWGIATAFYPAHRRPASARVRLGADGKAYVTSATHDIGTGAYTVFTQTAADALGLPVERVVFELGDTEFPEAPGAGGSTSTASVTEAIARAGAAAKARLRALAVSSPRSPFAGLPVEEIDAADGWIFARQDAANRRSYDQVLRAAGAPGVTVEASAPAVEDKTAPFAFHSFGVHFCEVKIDPWLPRAEVARVVSVMDVGRVMNLKTARSQVLGGVTMGIGMALMEETVYDPRTGRPVTDNLADYRVPVNADVPAIDVSFIDRPDPHFAALGCRGLGEIGITGVAAAVANAVYHATGRRVRDLPITPDKLL